MPNVAMLPSVMSTCSSSGACSPLSSYNTSRKIQNKKSICASAGFGFREGSSAVLSSSWPIGTELGEFGPRRRGGRAPCSNRWSWGSPAVCSVAAAQLAHLVKKSHSCCSLGSGLGLENAVIRPAGTVLWGRRQNQNQKRQQLRRRPRAKDDDFEIEDDGGFDSMELADIDEDDEEDFRDYETEYEAPNTGDIGRTLYRGESDTFISTEREVEETVVAWKINEDEFHKLSLLTCDFFIRKVPDPDDDVYDFREMYVTPPDTDIYSIPRVDGNLPKKPVRCTYSNYEAIHTTEPPVDEPRSPLAKTEFEVMKVFLTKHYKDRRAGHENFVLDFEEIYVIDSRSKSFYRANVQVDVPGGADRDRSEEVLIVRDGGTSFRIILEEDEKSPDEVVQTVHWEKSREAMENYLRGFRDYEVSNWF